MLPTIKPLIAHKPNIEENITPAPKNDTLNTGLGIPIINIVKQKRKAINKLPIGSAWKKLLTF